MYRPGIVFVGMETSGEIRRRLQARGFETYSCDLLPSEDGGEEMSYTSNGIPLGRHVVGDVFRELESMAANDMWPSAAVFHPDCTYLTNSAEWAYGDGPYHQKVKPETLVGSARRDAREKALELVKRIMRLPIKTKIIENPIGAISKIRKPTQIVQPYEFGDDASKATCLWILDDAEMSLPPIKLDPAKRVSGRMVNGRERWSNQTDGGFNKLTPSETRWKDRARTFPGIASAISDYIVTRLDAKELAA